MHPTADPSQEIRRSPWFAYVLAGVTLLGWFGGRFLMFLLPDASYWLLLIGAIGAIVAMIWLIACAFLPMPRAAPVLLAALVIMIPRGIFSSRSLKSQEWNRAFDKVRETEAAILRFHGATRLSGDFYLASLSY